MLQIDGEINNFIGICFRLVVPKIVGESKAVCIKRAVLQPHKIWTDEAIWITPLANHSIMFKKWEEKHSSARVTKVCVGNDSTPLY